VTTTLLAQQALPIVDVKSAGASLPADVLLALVADETRGLSSAEVSLRQARWGPNAVSSHRARFWPVMWHQLRSPLLCLLLIAAVASYFVGERSDAVIIGVIVALSVGLGFVNEYRAEKAAEALHSQIHHQAEVIRDGAPTSVDVSLLVPGDVVRLRLGEIVPADVRLLSVSELECDESVLTGESLPVEKHTDAVPVGTALAELSCCALMGTVVHSGTATGVVAATGVQTEFGKIAAGLSTHQLDTEFQVGLRKFSMLLVYVAGSLTTSIFIINVLLHKPILDALLFSLAIAVGITPQLLPAVVSTSLAAGARRMSQRKVLVKRLVCIEDLGNVDVLFTDKTGTLTLGRIDYMRAVPAGDLDPDLVLEWGLLCTENSAADGHAVGGNALDQAPWESPAGASLRAGLGEYSRLGVLPFDHERLMVSAVVSDRAGALTLVTKGAPETVLARCSHVPETARVALKVCHELGLADASCLTGAQIDAMDDTGLASAIAVTTVFARVSPEAKARIVRIQRRTGGGVAFLGDGVNDALALHAADVGISVDSGTDVAKDAADVILLEKDLGVLAEGRRIFANTIKYVLMGTSSNFGNMFSAAGASLFLSFLPMLASQILLNNLLYEP
jgi:Mg2+-importing ATPase